MMLGSRVIGLPCSSFNILTASVCSKEGLILASIADFLSVHFSRLQPLFEIDAPVRPFIELVTGILNSNTALARLIHDEILNDDSPLKDATISGFPSKVAEVLPELIPQNGSSMSTNSLSMVV